MIKLSTACSAITTLYIGLSGLLLFFFFYSFQVENYLLLRQNYITNLTSLAVVRNRLGTARLTELGLGGSSYRVINAQLVATIYGMTTKESATLAAVRSMVRIIGRMAVWLKSTMSLAFLCKCPCGLLIYIGKYNNSSPCFSHEESSLMAHTLPSLRLFVAINESRLHLQ